jgi:hypothetical protein
MFVDKGNVLESFNMREEHSEDIYYEKWEN